MDVQRARVAHALRVAAVSARKVDPHRDRLVGLVGDDHTLACLLPARTMLTRRRGRCVGARGPGLLTCARPLDPACLCLAPSLGHPLGLALLPRARRPSARLGSPRRPATTT